MVADISKRIVEISPERRTLLDAFVLGKTITGKNAPKPLPSYDWVPVSIFLIGKETHVRSITAQQFEDFLQGTEAQLLPNRRLPTLNFQTIALTEDTYGEVAAFLKKEAVDNGAQPIGRLAYLLNEQGDDALPAGQITSATLSLNTRIGKPIVLEIDTKGIDLRRPEKIFQFNPEQHKL